ncbi:MAG: hypothetical protein ABI222_12900 [Opitutaceae bacterium]
MKFPFRTVLVSVCLTLRLAAADPDTDVALPPPSATPAPAPVRTTADQKKLEAAIRERLAEHALRKSTKTVATEPIPAETPADKNAKPVAASAPAVSTAPTKPGASAATATAASSKEDSTMLLPRVEVNKTRVTEQLIKEHEKDVEIAREKKNTVPTTLDNALNDSDVSHSLAIFGGSSSDDRARLAQERVSLLEAEKDLLDEIARAPTKEERKELQDQLNELKTMRRELERAPRDERK